MRDPLCSAWTVRLGPNMFLDFCVWVLERDGYGLPPSSSTPTATAHCVRPG